MRRRCLSGTDRSGNRGLPRSDSGVRPRQPDLPGASNPEGGPSMKRAFARASLLVAVAALATTGLSIDPAYATTYQTCKTLKGTATLTPGLSATPRTQTITAKANAA